MSKSQYDNAASFYRYQQQQPASYVAGANALQQSFNGNNTRSKTPATPANTPVDELYNNNNTNAQQQELTLEQLPDSEYINGKFIMRGRVSKWFDQRGFGFIENHISDGSTHHQQQFFVHARDLITSNAADNNKTLFLGQAVEFEPEQTENGGHAMNVCALGGVPLPSAPTPAPASSTNNNTVEAARPLPSYTTAVETVVKQEQDHSDGASIIHPEQQNIIDEEEAALPQPRFRGTVAHWTVDKGYGFIEVSGQDEHFFTHIKDFTCAKSMPVAGDYVVFTPSYLSNRKRATHVTLPNSKSVATPLQEQQQQEVEVQQQQQQQPQKKKPQLSSLARAFALPEKKTV